MMKRNHKITDLLTLASIFFVSSTIFLTQSTFSASSAPAIGSTIRDFKLLDLGGKETSLNSMRGSKGTVLIFIATECPVSNGYNERMEKIAQEYRSRGINVIGINANASDPAEKVKQHAAEHKLTFPIFKDAGNKVADLLGAQVTPESYVLDDNNRLLYHGRIDNSREESKVVSSETREALEALLAGKPVARTQARAFGCTIQRVGGSS
ncbi:MAG: thioredoxin family protein [Pyrinomonadaceae bacterium]